MSTHIAKRFGVAGVLAATAAFAACLYGELLPYRISPAQSRVLLGAFALQFGAPLLAIIFGAVAQRWADGDTAASRLGLLAMVLGVVLLLIPTVHFHSIRRQTRERTPNQPLEWMAGGRVGSKPNPYGPAITQLDRWA
jgi:hypothetical protein